MYNAIKKQHFIDTIEDKEIAYKAFNWLQDFEESWKCDLSLQTNRNNLQKMVTSLMNRRILSEDYLILFRLYARWSNCDNALFEIIPNAIKILQTNTVPNPKGLNEYLDEVFRPEDDDSVDNVYRAFLWLAFGGMEERDTYELTSKNVDLDRNIIKYNGVNYPIYKEGMKSIKKCKENKSFVYYNNNYASGPIERYRYPSNQLLRGIRSEYTLKNKMMRVQISKIQGMAHRDNRTKMRLAYFNIWRSGVFYREVCRSNKNNILRTEFDAVADTMINIGARAYSKNDLATKQQKRDRIIRDLNKCYKQWIIAHNYV